MILSWGVSTLYVLNLAGFPSQKRNWNLESSLLAEVEE